MAKLKRQFDQLTLLAAAGFAIALFAGFLGSLHPAFDTFAHFRWHFGLLLAGLAVIFLVRSRRTVGLASLAIAAGALWSCLDAMPPRNDLLAANAGTKAYSLIHYNLKYDNPLKTDVVRLLETQDADLLSLSETTSDWRVALSAMNDRYPHRFHCPEWFIYGGVMVLSKFPLQTDETYCHDYAALGLVDTVIDGRKITVGSAHLRWPWPASGPSQVIALEPRLKGLAEDALIAGDFNAVPWSWAVRKFEADGGLRTVPGIGGTWIYKWIPGWFTPWLGLPIDTAMAKGSVRVTSVRTLPATGSDHLPILLKFELEQNLSPDG